MNELVHYKSEEGYAIITIANGKVNAISHEVIEGLNSCLDKAAEEKKVVILTGQAGILSGGYDLKVMTASADSAKELVAKGSQLSHKMLSFPMPIIVACGGHAVAKGAFLLLSCDYRLGVDGDFKIGLNEVMIGMTMHHAGIEIAKGRLAPVFFERSVNNSEMYSPKDAVSAGFLDKVVPAEHLLPTAVKIAGMFSALNKKAHVSTKLKLRKAYLAKIEAAIELDLKEAISLNL
ncbi:crotonase/enoyl-CoA hydratase family protein [Tenacibaculum maritimum]|uniref:crotonase/enoyl-CoA hydratase family protein n=1 Tax=Tenacibaculum maritimum TaxID=107401 RepID=UPI0012E5F3A9|nr:crotonase/enoyl-CoA hydratase family protein [Tenacibaculum maritimum]CAA0159010.1 Enoyl-CoA hydratase/isomerase family protein [Tenacibaculum maritimum]